jgi:hypothetical protein
MWPLHVTNSFHDSLWSLHVKVWLILSKEQFIAKYMIAELIFLNIIQFVNIILQDPRVTFPDNMNISRARIYAYRNK